MGRDTFCWTRLLKTLSNLTLNASRRGHLQLLWATSARASPYLNLPYFSLKLLPIVLLLHVLVKFPLQFSYRPLQVLGGCCEVSLVPFSLQAEQPQLAQPLLQPLAHCCGLFWPCSDRSLSVLC